MSPTIVIAGFGRSGTTWVADILGRAFGGLILFEPLHPSRGVGYATQLAYKRRLSDTEAMELSGYVARLRQKKIRNGWLVRNYIDVAWNDTTPGDVEAVFHGQSVIGFKEIRANFVLDQLVQSNVRLIYVERNAHAVIASILKRNFWELGWPQTRDVILSEALRHPALSSAHKVLAEHLLGTALSYEQQIALLWSLTKCIVDRLLKEVPVQRVKFEDLCRRPMEEANKLVVAMGGDSGTLQEGHLLRASKMTCRKFRNLRDLADTGVLEGDLPDQCRAEIDLVLHAFGFGSNCAGDGSRSERSPRHDSSVAVCE